MAISDGNLLAEVQRDALDPNVGLSNTLRKVMALGGVVGSTELREWASLELRGYVGSPTELPTYRKVPATLEVNGFNGSMQVKGFRLSPRDLPSFAQASVGEEVPLNSSVREIEEMARHAEAKGGHIALSPPMAQDLARVMNSEGRAPIRMITELYWSVSAAALTGVIDQVRTSLVELVAEMRANTPDSAELPTGEAADRAVNVAVYGNDVRVNVTAASASGSGAHHVNAEGYVEADRIEVVWPALREELAALDLPELELDDLHHALLRDGDPTGGELGVATSGWLGQLSTKLATGAIALSGATSTEVVTHVILKALGLA
jgi:AbiTii